MTKILNSNPFAALDEEAEKTLVIETKEIPKIKSKPKSKTISVTKNEKKPLKSKPDSLSKPDRVSSPQKKEIDSYELRKTSNNREKTRAHKEKEEPKHERKSRTGRRDNTKRSGKGQFNWGSDQMTVEEAQEEVSADVVEEEESGTKNKEKKVRFVEEETDKNAGNKKEEEESKIEKEEEKEEEEEETIYYDTYMDQCIVLEEDLKLKNRDVKITSHFNDNKSVSLLKKSDKSDFPEFYVNSSDQSEKKKKVRKAKTKQKEELVTTFESSFRGNRGRRQFRGNRGRRQFSGRGRPRGNRKEFNDSAPLMLDQDTFPSLAT